MTADAGDTNVGRDIIGWFRHHDEEESNIEIYLYLNKPPDSSVRITNTRSRPYS